MAGAIALGVARWLENCVACCVVLSSLHTSSHVLCIRPFSFSVQSCTMYIYIYLLRSTRSFPGLAMTLAWAGGIFIRYCKEDTCYTLVDLCCTFDSYIVYFGSSKKVFTALLTLADCVGSLNRKQPISCSGKAACPCRKQTWSLCLSHGWPWTKTNLFLGPCKATEAPATTQDEAVFIQVL